MAKYIDVNQLKGYIKADNPGKLVPLKDGWYNTGDVVEVETPSGVIGVKILEIKK